MPRLEQEFISVVFKSHFCSGSRRGISAKVTFPTSVTVNTTLWWRRRRSITTQALTYLRCVAIFPVWFSTFTSQDGSLLVTLVPSNLPMTTVVGLYSLRKESLGDCHATYSLESSAVSVSLSPTSRHLLVGLTSRWQWSPVVILLLFYFQSFHKSVYL